MLSTCIRNQCEMLLKCEQYHPVKAMFKGASHPFCITVKCPISSWRLMVQEVTAQKRFTLVCWLGVKHEKHKANFVNLNLLFC